ncbi:hypothetical protein ACFVWR_10590 [Leifsonia sp. NPDC058292]|uniref:hypothetical protein n=1 Tax=Leifsonia sp. NPDC058292 TaxID=3346428 RepID=UPI0036DA9404
MPNTVTFLGLTVAEGVPPADELWLWSYRIESGGAPGSSVALVFPAGAPIRDPASTPGLPAVAGVTLQKDVSGARQYVAKKIVSNAPVIVSFLSDASGAPAEVLLAIAPDAAAWSAAVFSSGAEGQALSHLLPAPAPVKAKPAPSSPTDFTGTLPYASEIFGVYQPLAGWLGKRSVAPLLPANQDPASTPLRQDVVRTRSHSDSLLTRFVGENARLVLDPAIKGLIGQVGDANLAVLSPVGLVSLYREYFFEFDNFLGAPSGHLWISPGGTVEVMEVSTRRTLVQRTTEQSESVTQKSEETLTTQDDVADAVKEDNANDTKLGASASAGAKFAGIYQADASASFSNDTSTKKSSEVTHKHTRTQSARVSSEIQRNFKTTFTTVSESTDVTSRRYVVQNTTNTLVNYELRRKMRKVGVQVQHIGTRLSWQVFLDAPGRDLGLGDLVHVVTPPDLDAIRKPEAPTPLQPKEVEYSSSFVLKRYGTTKNDPHQDANYTRSAEAPPGGITGMHSDDNADHINGDQDYVAPPPADGYTISAIRAVSARTQGGDAQFLAHYDWLTGSTGAFTLKAQFLNFGGGRIIDFTVAITWKPPSVDPAQLAYQQELVDYQAQVADAERRAYVTAIRERMNLVSSMERRPSEDLREEERYTVYGRLVRDLRLFDDPHVDSELIRQIFDVDEMLYFAAPDYWRASPVTVPETSAASEGKYPVPDMPSAAPADALDGSTVASWYSLTDDDNAVDPSGAAHPEWRKNYAVTEESSPAPFGSSLGWLVQIDADERRNEFLNAAWVKAVLPIRVGHELEALDWLEQAGVEGETGLGKPYPVQPGDPPEYAGKTLSEVLHLLAAELQASNTDITNTLATEKVFETGFDPLQTGFKPAEPYEVFDQWTEVLPTDQIVAVQVEYDPKSGRLL